MPDLRLSTPSDRWSDAGSRRGPFWKAREGHTGGRRGVTCEGCRVGRCVPFRVAPGLYGNKSEPLPESAKNSGPSPAARDAGKGGKLVRASAQRSRKPSGQLAAPDELHRQGLADGLLTQPLNRDEDLDDEDDPP